MTLRENHSAFQRMWLRPRVMVNKLGNPEGELGWVRGAARSGTIFMAPTLSSCSFDDIFGACAPGQVLWFQLYVNPNRSMCKELVQTAEQKGCRALFITAEWFSRRVISSSAPD
eukprot:gene1087-15950_t